MKDIVQQGNPVLRATASYISPEAMMSPSVMTAVADMHASLATQKDGVALAAPQIGISLQIFVVAPHIFKESGKHNLVYINPEIIASSDEKEWLDEGCLSCRWKIGQVERAKTVVIRAFDEYGNQFEEQAEGLLAHIFQHETDHLHGVLFIDKARDLRDMTIEEIREAQGLQ